MKNLKFFLIFLLLLILFYPNYKNLNIYQNETVFLIEHPNGEDASCASGRIVDINKYEFLYELKSFENYFET